MPAGVLLIKQRGENVLVGNLSYFSMSTELCSLCQAMESAVASRPWFVKAHAEYLVQIKVKRQMLGPG